MGMGVLVSTDTTVEVVLLPLLSDESTDSPLGFFFHHPSGEGEKYFITSGLGLKSRFPVWSLLTLRDGGDSMSVSGNTVLSVFL